MSSGRSNRRLWRPHRHAQALPPAFAVTCLALGCFASGASAGPNGYSTPVNLSGGGGPQVAVDPAGRATVAWNIFDGANSRVQAARLGRAGNPGRVKTLSRPGQDAVRPAVAVDPAGRATVAWDSRRIEAVRLDAAGHPDPVETLSPAGLLASGPQVAVGPDGGTTVVWVGDEHGDCSNRVVQAVRLDTGGAPGPVQTLSRYRDLCDSTVASPPGVAVDAEGRVTVVWRRNDLSNTGVWGARLDPEGNPGPVQLLSEPGEWTSSPEVAVDPDGRATVVWSQSTSSSRAVQAVQIDAAGNPEPIQTLSRVGLDPQLAVDARGLATVVWRRSDGSNMRVQATRVDAAGIRGPVQTLSPAGKDALSPEIAVDPDGRATVVWKRRSHSGHVQAVRLDPAGNPGPVQTVSRNARPRRLDTPEVAVDSTGRATVVWESPSDRILAAHSLRLFEVTATPRLILVDPRTKVRYRLRATNRDTGPSGAVRLCAREWPHGRLRLLGKRCEVFANVDPGASAERLFRFRVLDPARGKLSQIRLRARGPNLQAAARTVSVRVRRRPSLPPEPYRYGPMHGGRDTSALPTGERR
jgi:hypothetical protein